MIVVSHPTGNQNSRQTAKAFAEVGWLSSFGTALHVSAANPVVRLLPRSIHGELARRDFSEVGGHIRNEAAVREATRLVAGRLGWKKLSTHETGWASVDQVYRAVDRSVSKRLGRGGDVRAVYSYEDGALDTFRAAKNLGIARIYELPIGYWREHHRLNEVEWDRQPQWAPTWAAVRDSTEKLMRKDAEIALADVVIVASRFTEQTLKSFPHSLPPVRMVPYACPPPIGPEQRRWYRSGALRLLFVGSLSQRKGMAEIVQTVSSLGTAVDFTVVGVGPGAVLLRKALPNTVFLGSISHAGVLEQMRSHDVLLFPSLFEGFGMVITEALSQGMVVIASDRTGLPCVADESCSRCIPAGSGEALLSAVAGLLERPADVRTIGLMALERAGQWQWPDYRRELRSVVEEFWKP